MDKVLLNKEASVIAATRNRKTYSGNGVHWDVRKEFLELSSSSLGGAITDHK